jgi:hypothetical protein
MKPQESNVEDLAAELAKASAKAHLWREKATKAQQDGRVAAAQRCKDKALDWASRAEQLARRKKVSDTQD